MESPEHNSAPDEHPEGRRRPPFGGLASKLLLLVLVLTFVAATLVGWISIESTRRSLLAAIVRLYPRSLDHAAGRLDAWIEDICGELEHASRDPNADALAWTVENSPQLIGVALFARDETLRASTGDVPPELAHRALASRRGRAAGHTSDGRPAIAVAVHQPRGSVVGVVPVSRLGALLELELPSDIATMAITDPDGRILAKAGPPSGPLPLERLKLHPPEGERRLREYELGDLLVVGTGRRLDLFGWNIAVAAPLREAYGPMRSVMKRVFVADLCIILLASLLAYRIAERTVRPIEELSEATRRVAHGETNLEIREFHGRDEIALLTRTFNDMVRQIRRDRAQIETANRNLTDRNARLEQANELLSQLSITDGLTKLHNHRYFQDHLTREIKRVSRSREPLSMMILDLDDFKRLNDRLGHAAGDEILARIAQILNEAVRETDLCARYGGEEFVILAANTEVDGAYRLAEKVRLAIAESSFIVDDSLRPLRATVSIGVACFRGNRKRFFQQADQALYRAKANGKNCVVVYDEGESI